MEALRKSKTEFIEVSENEDKIRRNPNKPLPEVTEQYRNEVKNRSVYIVSKWNIAYSNAVHFKLLILSVKDPLPIAKDSGNTST